MMSGPFGGCQLGEGDGVLNHSDLRAPGPPNGKAAPRVTAELQITARRERLAIRPTRCGPHH